MRNGGAFLRYATAIADGGRALPVSASEPPKDGDVVVDERLGGLLRSYRRSA